ncbi:MAG TPA: GAF domain-containing protein, partial [Ktedonobacterales bacterium]|nr:GAF domain-containing protein [Ktedonobacterales bacterium]
MFRWLDRKKGGKASSSMLPTGISETEVIGAATEQPTHQWATELKVHLLRALEIFGLDESSMAEALISTSGTQQLITVGIQPETSVALASRVREGRSVVWRAYSSGRPVIASLEARDARSRSIDTSEQTTLFSTRSALVHPLRSDGVVIGVLNLESGKTAAFPSDAISLLESSGVIQSIENEMKALRREFVSDSALVRDILAKMRDKIAFTIAQDDMTETYYQILRVATAIVSPTNVSGGLILVREQEQNLAVRGDGRKLFAVRAGRIGDFNSEPEWEWIEGSSIAWRIYNQQRGEVIDHAQTDRNYRDSGTTLGETSELIVPLVASGKSLGVIGLVAPGIRAFSRSTDLPYLDEVAEIAVYAISRSTEYAKDRRLAEELKCAIELQDLLAPLFPGDGKPVKRDL